MRGMRASGRPAVAVPVGVVLSVVLTGCFGGGDDPEPGVLPTTSLPVATTPIPPSAPAPVAPTLPAAAKAGTRAGAEAFFRYFWDVYNYSYDALDTAQLRAISDAACKFCTDSAQSVDERKRGGGRYEGGRVTVRSVIASPTDPAVGVLVNSILDQADGKTFGSGNALVREASGARSLRIDGVVRWRNASWTVLTVDARAQRETP